MPRTKQTDSLPYESKVPEVPVVKCSRCGKEMVVGFLLDMAHGAAMQSHWVEGRAEKRTFVGGVKIRKKRKMFIDAMRCESCGLIELYANRACDDLPE